MAQENIAKCPACRREVKGPVAVCPHCQVSLRKLDMKFGVAPKHLGAITDHAQILSAAERRRLTTKLSLFHRKFPQTLFEVVVADGPAGRAIGEYTFWLANRMHFGTPEATGENNFDFLLVVDTAGSSGLSAGYGLESFVAEEDLAAALEAARADFAAELWAAGIESCIDHLLERLRELCEKSK